MFEVGELKSLAAESSLILIGEPVDDPDVNGGSIVFVNATNEISNDGWTVAADKIYSSALPARLKVHGLLVHGASVRLTKGYRNRIRAYRHLLKQGKISEEDMKSILGHISYAEFVEKL